MHDGKYEQQLVSKTQIWKLQLWEHNIFAQTSDPTPDELWMRARASVVNDSHVALNINTWTPCWSLSCCWDMKHLKIFTHAIRNKPNIKTVDFIPCLSAAIHSWNIFYTQVCVCVCDSEQHRISVCGFYVVFSNIKWFLL